VPAVEVDEAANVRIGREFEIAVLPRGFNRWSSREPRKHVLQDAQHELELVRD